MIKPEKFQKAWDNAIKVIQLENTLEHHRMTAMLTLQGLLLAAFSFAIKSVLESKMIDLKIFVLYLFSCLLVLIGLVSSWSFHGIMKCALIHVDTTRYWFYFYWRSVFRNNEHDCPPFPSLTGGGEFDPDYNWYYDTENYSEENYKTFIEKVLEQNAKKHCFYNLLKLDGSLGAAKVLFISWLIIATGLFFIGKDYNFFYPIDNIYPH